MTRISFISLLFLIGCGSGPQGPTGPAGAPAPEVCPCGSKFSGFKSVCIPKDECPTSPEVIDLDYTCQRQGGAYICDNEKTGDRLDIVILNNGDGTYRLTGLLVKGLPND